MMAAPLKAPFVYFGGKRTIAPQVWSRFGNVGHYIEPFFGSGAVLLARPTEPQLETVNDLDGNLANAWRAIQRAPEETAEWADYPVSECDLHARHLWLLNTGEERADRLMADPDWCDPKAAGWWVWGMSCWIGSGFCSGDGPWVSDGERLVKRESGGGIERKRPHLATEGKGVRRKRPHLANTGVGVCRTLPRLSTAGQGVNEARNAGTLQAYFAALSDRLARVRICCGDWTRVTGPSVLTATGGICGVFLDPPYTSEAGRYMGVYRHDCGDVGHAAYRWAMDHADDPKLRIILAGYFEEHDALIPDTWERIAWKSAGGYGSQGNGRGRANRERETLWCSPHCVRPDTNGPLFANLERLGTFAGVESHE